MKKFYTLFFLLLGSLTTYAQQGAYSRFFYDIPGGSAEVLDFKGNRLLYRQDSTYRIHELYSGIVTDIPLTTLPAYAEQQDKRGWLTDSGAFITTISEVAGMVSLYEWRNDSLLQIEKQATKVEVGGDHVLFTSWGYFYYKRPGEETVRISTNPGTFAMSPEGWYLYSLNDTMYRYKNGATTPFAIGEETTERFLFVQIEHQKVLYMMEKAHQNPTLYLHNGTSADTVVVLRGIHQQMYPKRQYRLHNGYVAYVSVDRAGNWPFPQQIAETNIYVRDSTGTTRKAFQQLGGRNVGYVYPEIWGINERGGVLIRKNDYMWQNGLHYAAMDSASKFIDPIVWNTYYIPTFAYQDSAWYTFYRDSAYQLRPDTTFQHIVKPFEVPVLANTPYYFSLETLLDHYTAGRGEMTYAGFYNGPQRGDLILRQDTINLIPYKWVPRGLVDSLRYMPYPDVTGLDSVEWRADDPLGTFSGFAWLRFHIYPKLPAPALSGLDSSYCNSGSQSVKITNYPAEGAITAWLDNAIQLAVNAADSTFSFNPDNLPPGLHQITVRFSHPADSAFTTAGFRTGTGGGAPPVVTLSANINIINNNRDTIVITAHGNGPGLYTFARDAAFTNLLRGEGADSVLKLHPSAFTRTNNDVYVQMKTTGGCSTDSIATDNIRIVKTFLSGIPGRDFDNKNLIIVYPNPFTTQFTVEGLESSKKYKLTLHALNGTVLLTTYVNYLRKFTVVPNVSLRKGIYFLEVFDLSTQKVASGSILLKM